MSGAGSGQHGCRDKDCDYCISAEQRRRASLVEEHRKEMREAEAMIAERQRGADA